MTSNPTNMQNTVIDPNTNTKDICDGCDKKIDRAYIDDGDHEGEPCYISREAGQMMIYCAECWTRRPEGTPYDRKGLDSNLLKQDDEIA